MVLMVQVVQNRSVCLEHRGYATDIGPRTHTALGGQVSGLPEPTDRNTKAKGWSWLGPWQPEPGTGEDCGTVEVNQWPQVQKYQLC